VLINNAGILKTVPLTDSSDDLFDQTFAVNAGAPSIPRAKPASA